MRAVCRCLVSIACTLLLVSRSIGDDHSVRSAFLEQYQPHAQAIQQHYTNIRIKFTRTIDYGNGKGQVDEGEGKYNLLNYVLDGYGKGTNTTKPDIASKGHRSIEGRNIRYAFTLLPTDDNQYVLTDLRIQQPGLPAPLLYMTVPFADYFLGRKSYLDMAMDETIEFLEFNDCVWENKPAKELKLRILVRNPPVQAPFHVVAAYYFSPEEGWICRGRQTGWREGKSPTSADKYYYERQAGQAFPALVRLEDWRKGKLFGVTRITEFEHCPPFPDSDFTLSAFGLPEPVGVEPVVAPSRSRWYLWLALAGLGCLALAFGFRSAARFLRSKQNASTTLPT